MDIFAGPRLRRQAIARTEQHILDVALGRFELGQEIRGDGNTKKTYIEEERARLAALKNVGRE